MFFLYEDGGFERSAINGKKNISDLPVRYYLLVH